MSPLDFVQPLAALIQFGQAQPHLANGSFMAANLDRRATDSGGFSISCSRRPEPAGLSGSP
jgi:hypothetical protein